MALNACRTPSESEPTPLDEAPPTVELTREPIQPLPQPVNANEELAALGKVVFHDPRLSRDNTLACASCHDLGTNGADSVARSRGMAGALGEVNAPTVFNASLNFAQFWDGRAATLEDQVDGPIQHPKEMASSWEEVLPKLRADPKLVDRFRAVFSETITADNVKRSLAAFERTLITRGSTFDRWLAGDAGALSDEAKSGYELFKSLGCVACHQGANVGGNMFQKFGVLGDYFEDRGDVTPADYGRFNVTGMESDRFVFRVPSLRYAVHTAPYFHDGTAATLPDAIQTMAKYQLGRDLTEAQVSRLTAFLTSLAGPLPGK
jgi:cytochrome c peroxidase